MIMMLLVTLNLGLVAALCLSVLLNLYLSKQLSDWVYGPDEDEDDEGDDGGDYSPYGGGGTPNSPGDYLRRLESTFSKSN